MAITYKQKQLIDEEQIVVGITRDDGIDADGNGVVDGAIFLDLLKLSDRGLARCHEQDAFPSQLTLQCLDGLGVVDIVALVLDVFLLQQIVVVFLTVIG